MVYCNYNFRKRRGCRKRVGPLNEVGELMHNIVLSLVTNLKGNNFLIKIFFELSLIDNRKMIILLVDSLD